MEEEIFSFMAFGLSHGNDTDFVFAFGMRDHDDFSVQKPDRGKAHFPVVESVIGESERFPGKHALGIDQVQPMLDSIEPLLFAIETEVHGLDNIDNYLPCHAFLQIKFDFPVHRGIASKTMRIGYENCKGYDRLQFQDTFERYLSTPPELSVTKLQTSCSNGLSVTDMPNASVTKIPDRLQVTKSVTEPPSVTESWQSDSQKCNRVTDGKACNRYENSLVTLEALQTLDCNRVTDKRGEAEDNTIEVEI
jgi:hypothetical protein